MVKPLHILLAVVITAIWGFNFVVIKVGVAEVPPLLLTGLRFVFAAVPAVFLVAPPRVGPGTVGLYGFTLGVIKFGLLFVAIHQGLSAGLASLVLQLQAFFTILLAFAALGEKPRLLQMLGAGVAFTGIGVIAAGRWQGPDFVPLLLVVLAAFFWGIANVTAKRAGKVDMLSFIVWASLVPPLPLFLLSWMVEDHTAILAAITSPGPLALGAVAYLAWPTTLFGFGAWNFLMGKYSASVIAPFSLLVPVFGTASGVIVLGERLDRVAVLGGGLVLTGLVLNVLAARRRPTAAA